ncbi:MAG: hypothetical protein ABIR04_04365 [Cypionkella sp.]
MRIGTDHDRFVFWTLAPEKLRLASLAIVSAAEAVWLALMNYTQRNADADFIGLYNFARTLRDLRFPNAQQISGCGG